MIIVNKEVALDYCGRWEEAVGARAGEVRLAVPAASGGGGGAVGWAHARGYQGHTNGGGGVGWAHTRGHVLAQSPHPLTLTGAPLTC